MWKSEGNFPEPVTSFHLYMFPGGQTQAIRRVQQALLPLEYLTGPQLLFNHY